MSQWWRSALGTGRSPSADQEAAIVASPLGRQIVTAGAGTGKTSTLALRALYLIEAGHIRADQLVVLTFTNKAAAGIGSRIADTLDRAILNGAEFDDSAQRVHCTTIHALAAELLREFRFDFGLAIPPRPITDGEAYGIFHESFKALLDSRLDVDASMFPIAEVNLETLERDLGRLALRLKNHGISAATFATRAFVQADRLAEQAWGQLWTAGGVRTRRTKCKPKQEVSLGERAAEVERERANILVMQALLADFDRRLRQHGVATYGDLIGLATRLLRERPELQSRLRERWRYVLLDESQDTSSLQLAFIETIFGRADDPDAAGMMPVGDSRQSIYGFNGADESVMQRLGSGIRPHALTVNRRSTQEIVDAAHAVLLAATIVDSTAQQLSASAGPGGLECVRVEHFGEPGGTIKEHVEREAAAIARETQRLLGGGSVKSSAIAILVRRRTHATAYVRALNRLGIAAALDRRTGLFAADEIRDVLAWMALLIDLNDRQAAARILQSRLCGLSDASMIALTAQPDWLTSLLHNSLSETLDGDIRLRLAGVRDRLIELLPLVALPLPAAIEQLLDRLPLAASYRGLGEAIGAQAGANLRGFEELAYTFADAHPRARLRDFLDDVKRRIAYDDDPQEAELDVDGVRVLTIHQAKGLEWPFVFVACSTKSQYNSIEQSDRVVNYDLTTGAFALKNDIDGRETLRWVMSICEHDPQTGERIEPAPRKAAAEREEARVFYVAVTRAKQRVYITAPAPDANRAVSHLSAIRAWAQSADPGIDLGFDAPRASATRSADVAQAEPLPAAAPR